MTGFHDPSCPPAVTIKDEYPPAPIIAADFGAGCMDTAVAFLLLLDESEERAGFGPIGKGARLKILIQKEGGFVGINHHCRPLTAVSVPDDIPEIAEIGFYHMDKTEVAAAVAALAAFK